MTITPNTQLQAIVEAIAKSDGSIGGLSQTRTLAAIEAIERLVVPLVWQGTDTVLCADTSGFSLGEFIKFGQADARFEIIAIDPNVSLQIDTRGLPVPTGPTVTALAATLTWDGSTTVAASATGELGEGVSIRLDSDGQWFEIEAVDPGVSVTITNPDGLTIPTGAGASSWAVTPQSSRVTVNLPVQSLLDWPPAGKFVMGGVLHHYESHTKSPPILQRVWHQYLGEQRYGIDKDQPPRTTLTNVSRNVSALDRLYRAMVVAFAEGDDLNVVGRNVGVDRYPFLESDDTFREVVQALAYNPRGTLFGIELALTALIGAGNFRIFEDLIGHPNTVFVDLLGGPFTNNSYQGKAFLTGPEWGPLTAPNILTLDFEPVDRGAVYSVRLKPEGLLTDCLNEKPSVQTVVEYELATPLQVWLYDGVSEGMLVTVLPGLGCQITHSPGTPSRYVHETRITPDAYVEFDCVINIPSTGGFSSLVGDVRQWAGVIEDGAFFVGWGTTVNGGSAFIRLISGTDFGAFQATIALDEYHAITVKKFGTNYVELWVDGIFQDRQPYSAFTDATGWRMVSLGVQTPLPMGVVTAILAQIGLHVEDPTEYHASRGDAATVTALADRDLDTGVAGSFVAPDDIGKRLVVSGSAITNGAGGNNNGVFQIESIGSDQLVTLAGAPQTGATVQGGFPTRITVSSDGQQFQFPDDLGKVLVVTNSTLGNNGSYVVADLLDPDTLASLLGYATIIPQKTTVAEVIGATFVTESNLAWRLDPAFENETPVDWELSATSALTGVSLALRQNPAVSGNPAIWVFGVHYSAVLSAQVLLSLAIANQLLQAAPTLIFSHYPFYLADPLGFVRFYLEDIKAAGVILELR